MGKKKYLHSICHVLLLLLLTLNSPPRGDGCGIWLCERGGCSSPKLMEFWWMESVRMPHEQSALLLSCCSSLELCSDRPMAFQRQGARGRGALWEPFFSWAASSSSFKDMPGTGKAGNGEGTERNQSVFVCHPLPTQLSPAQLCPSQFPVPSQFVIPAGVPVSVTASALGDVTVFQVIEWIIKKEMLPCVMQFLNGNSLFQV